ncbi:MAG: cupin [Chloroflexia bacterium]
MKLYRFGPDAARHITNFGSDFGMSMVFRGDGPLQGGCMHIGAGGLVGYHQTTVPQLFLVTAGEGWVRGEGPERTPIRSGTAAFWVGGEWHEAGSETGMTAIVIEGEGIDLAPFMPEV